MSEKGDRGRRRIYIYIYFFFKSERVTDDRNLGHTKKRNELERKGILKLFLKIAFK